MGDLLESYTEDKKSESCEAESDKISMDRSSVIVYHLTMCIYGIITYRYASKVLFRATYSSDLVQVL